MRTSPSRRRSRRSRASYRRPRAYRAADSPRSADETRSRAKLREPAQGAQSRHEAILTSAHHDEAREAAEALWERSLRDGEPAGSLVRTSQWILGIGQPQEVSLVDPFRLNELELSSE